MSAICVGPFWPHTAPGRFWPVSHLDSLWDLSLHTQPAASEFRAAPQETAAADIPESSRASVFPRGDFDQFCQPIGLGDTKYQCTLCRKLFRAPEFVYKHLQEKHFGANSPSPGLVGATPGTTAGASSVPSETPAVVPGVQPTAEPCRSEAPRESAPGGSLAERLLAQSDFLIEEAPEAVDKTEKDTEASTAAVDSATSLEPTEPRPAVPDVSAAVSAAAPTTEETESTGARRPSTVEDFCKEVSSGKFQCTICSKMFKGPDFVYKHLRQKHPSDIEALAGSQENATAAISTPPASSPAAECPLHDDVALEPPELVEVPASWKAQNMSTGRHPLEGPTGWPQNPAGAAVCHLLPQLATAEVLAGRSPTRLQAAVDDYAAEPEQTPARGSLVELTGLNARAELNGMRGVVALKEGSTGRFEVTVQGTGERVRVKPENLLLVAVKRRQKLMEGNEAFNEGRTEQAIAFYSSALEEAATDHTESASVLHSNLSAALAKRRNYTRALEEAQKALQLRPSWATAYSRKGFSLLEMGRTSEAQSTYTKALQLDPVDEASLAGLKRATEELAKDQDVTTRGAEAERRRAKGREAARVGDLPAAVVLYTMALALLEPLVQVSQDALAVCLSSRSAVFAKLCQWTFALADAQTAAEVKPSWFQAKLRIAQALLGQGHAELSWLTHLDAGAAPAALRDEAAKSREQTLWRIPSLESPLAARWLGRFDTDSCRPAGSCRILAISGLHLDRCASALSWVRDLPPFSDDILLVSSLGESLAVVKEGLALLKSKFRRVFYIPGEADLNPRLRLDREGDGAVDGQGQGQEQHSCSDSLEKLLALLQLSESLDVEMLPAEVMRGVFVLPLLSWCEKQGNCSSSSPCATALGCRTATVNLEIREPVGCHWFMGEEAAQTFFARWNEPLVKRLEKARQDRAMGGSADAAIVPHVISMSHFLPVRELAQQEVHPAAAYSHLLEEQIQRAGSQLHIFGCTRHNEVKEVRAVTYQQHSLLGPDFSFSQVAGAPLLNIYDGRILVPGKPQETA